MWGFDKACRIDIERGYTNGHFRRAPALGIAFVAVCLLIVQTTLDRWDILCIPGGVRQVTQNIGSSTISSRELPGVAIVAWLVLVAGPGISYCFCLFGIVYVPVHVAFSA